MGLESVRLMLQLAITLSLAGLHLGATLSSGPCQEVNNKTAFLPDPNGNCSSFYVCTRGRATQLSCQPGVWDNTTSACVPKHSQFDLCSEDRQNVSSFCVGGQSGLSAHQNNCAQYYDCHIRHHLNDQYEPRIVECPYPMLFNNNTHRCEPYRFVDCGSRYEPRQPCEYLSNHCQSVGTTICKPCSRRFPSCAGLEDGLQPWSGNEWTSMFMTCKDQRVLTRGRCPSSTGRDGIFHPKLKYCVSMLTE